MHYVEEEKCSIEIFIYWKFSYSFFPIAIFPPIDKTSKRVIPLFLIWKMEISLKWKSRKKDGKSLDKHENNKQKNCSYIYTQYNQCLWKNIPSKTKLKPHHIWIMEASLFATLTIKASSPLCFGEWYPCVKICFCYFKNYLLQNHCKEVLYHPLKVQQSCWDNFTVLEIILASLQVLTGNCLPHWWSKLNEITTNKLATACKVSLRQCLYFDEPIL